MDQYLFEMPAQNAPTSDNKPFIGIKRLRKATRNQIEFKMESINDLIPQEHRVRDVWEYVSELDLSFLYEDIKVGAASKGPGTIDPKILTALWLFAILNGIISAREIDRLCKEHHAYIWICGGVSINYHTLSDFRTKNNNKFEQLLKESIAIMWKTGIFSPEHADHVSQDGTKIKANAGSNSLKREPKLEEHLILAEKYLLNLEKEFKANPSIYSSRQKAAKLRAAKERKERLEKSIEELKAYKISREESCKRNGEKLKKEDADKIRISTTDPECRNIKMANNGVHPAYNVQFATTTKGKIIIGAEVVNTLDPGTLIPMMKQVEENLQPFGFPMPSKWTADSTYANKYDVNLAAELFSETTLYAPPGGNQKLDGLSPRAHDTPAMKELRERMKTEEGKKIYSERCHTAEFANAVVKNKGMTKFLVRGLAKVTNMALIYVVMHNMMRFWDLLKALASS